MRSKTFLSYYPLKQGLKLLMKENYEKELAEFLSYYPLKQGLKLFKSGNITINQDSNTSKHCHQHYNEADNSVTDFGMRPVPEFMIEISYRSEHYSSLRLSS